MRVALWLFSCSLWSCSSFVLPCERPHPHPSLSLRSHSHTWPLPAKQAHSYSNAKSFILPSSNFDGTDGMNSKEGNKVTLSELQTSLRSTRSSSIYSSDILMGEEEQHEPTMGSGVFTASSPQFANMRPRGWGMWAQEIPLKWAKKPARVLVVSKPVAELLPYLFEATITLQNIFKLEVILEPHMAEELNRHYNLSLPINQVESAPPVDFVVTLGGDGLLMYTSTLFKSSVPPVMCFNFGSLGFLTPFQYSTFNDELQRLLEGDSHVVIRMRIQCDLYQSGKYISSYNVLNEVVLDRGPSPYLSNLELYCDSLHITTVQADGIILATPTGSTAYSMAAGGSCVHPSVPAILVTPICAHSLSFRPLIFPDTSTLSVEVSADARNDAWVCFDGKQRQRLGKGDRLDIRVCPHPLPTVNRLNHTGDWFHALRSAFSFNSRPRQQPF